MADIYHIVKRSQWEAAAGTGKYSPTSLDNEGFIHCCRQWQLLDIADARYSGQEDLVVLRIDVDGVVPEIRNEDLYNDGETYPHIYGQLDVEAVRAAVPFPPNDDGTFSMPAGLD